MSTDEQLIGRLSGFLTEWRRVCDCALLYSNAPSDITRLALDGAIDRAVEVSAGWGQRVWVTTHPEIEAAGWAHAARKHAREAAELLASGPCLESEAVAEVLRSRWDPLLDGLQLWLDRQAPEPAGGGDVASDPPAGKRKRKRGRKPPKRGRPTETEKFEFYTELVEWWKREHLKGRSRKEFIDHARRSELGERFKSLFPDEPQLKVEHLRRAQTYLRQRNARHSEAENPEK